MVIGLRKSIEGWTRAELADLSNQLLALAAQHAAGPEGQTSYEIWEQTIWGNVIGIANGLAATHEIDLGMVLEKATRDTFDPADGESAPSGQAQPVATPSTAPKTVKKSVTSPTRTYTVNVTSAKGETLDRVEAAAFTLTLGGTSEG